MGGGGAAWGEGLMEGETDEVPPAAFGCTPGVLRGLLICGVDATSSSQEIDVKRRSYNAKIKLSSSLCLGRERKMDF